MGFVLGGCLLFSSLLEAPLLFFAGSSGLDCVEWRVVGTLWLMVYIHGFMMADVDTVPRLYVPSISAHVCGLIVLEDMSKSSLPYRYVPIKV